MKAKVNLLTDVFIFLGGIGAISVLPSVAEAVSSPTQCQQSLHHQDRDREQDSPQGRELIIEELVQLLLQESIPESKTGKPGQPEIGEWATVIQRQLLQTKMLEFKRRFDSKMTEPLLAEIAQRLISAQAQKFTAGASQHWATEKPELHSSQTLTIAHPQLRIEFKSPLEFNELSLAPNRKFFATLAGNRVITIWDFNGNILRTLEEPSITSLFYESIYFSPDGTNLIATASNNNIHRWSVENGTYQGILPGEPAGHQILMKTKTIYHPDGKSLAQMFFEPGLTRFSGFGVILKQVKNGKKIQNFPNLFSRLFFDNARVLDLEFSPDGQFLATVSDDSFLRIWSVQSGRLRHAIHCPQGKSLSYSPDGRLIATTSQDKTAKIWDAQSGRLQQTLEGSVGQSRPINHVAWSSDSTRVVTSGNDGVAIIWEVKSAQPLIGIPASPKGDWIYASAFSSDQSTLITLSHNGLRVYSLFSKIDFHWVDQNSSAEPPQ